MSDSLRYRCDACNARYNGRQAALLCCTSRFEPDAGPDGHLVNWKHALGGDALA